MSDFDDRDYRRNASGIPSDWEDQAPADDDLILDNEGIPILNEVVYQDGNEDEELDAVEAQNPREVTQPGPSAFNLNLPNHNALLTAIREQVRTKLNREMLPIIMQISDKVAAEVASEFSRRFEDEFQHSLKAEIETLIDEALDKELK